MQDTIPPTVKEARDRLAKELYEIGAVPFELSRLKCHDREPGLPLSPVYFKLRTAKHPSNPGPLTDQHVRTIATQFRTTVVLKRLKHDMVTGIPEAGVPFAREYSDVLPGHRVPIVELIKGEREGKRRIVGVKTLPAYLKGRRVLLLDDVITEADTKEEAIEVLRSLDAIVEHLLVVVDREQGGVEKLRKIGVETTAIFSLTQLMKFYQGINFITKEKHDEVLAYLSAARQAST